MGVYLSKCNAAMNKKSKKPQPNKYKIILLILAAGTLLFSSYNLITNLKFINPFVEIAGQVSFAEASTRKVHRNIRWKRHRAFYLSEVVFMLQEKKQKFWTTKDVTDDPDDRQQYRLVERLKKSKQVIVKIKDFDKEDDKPKVYGLYIDGEEVICAETTRNKETISYLAPFLISLMLLLLFGFKVFDY